MPTATATVEEKYEALREDVNNAIFTVGLAVGSKYTMTGSASQAAQCASRHISDLETEIRRLTAELEIASVRPTA